MARNYSKKSRKTDPSYAKRRSNAPDVQRVIPIAKVTETSAHGLIQVDRLLSGLNHRLYRQCGNYRMKISILGGDANVDEVKVFALSNTWATKNAISLARTMHDKAMEEERAMGVQSRWYDFRINPNSAAVDDYVQALRANPFVSTTLTVHPGEYAYSEVEDAAGALRTFQLPMGGSGTGYDVFAEYDRTGNTGRDPVFHLTQGAYDGVDASVESENIESLANKGNQPPYHDSTILQDYVVQVGTLFRRNHVSISGQPSYGQGTQKESTGFFDAPLGLVWIQQGNSTKNPLLQVEVQRGDYKGVHMEAY